MAQACIMPHGPLADDRAGEPAPSSPQADFITSAARCKRKAVSGACEGGALRITATPGSPRAVSDEVNVGTPVKTIKLLHAFGWLPVDDSDAAPTSPRRAATGATLRAGSHTRTPPPCAAWDGGCRLEHSTSTSSTGSLSGAGDTDDAASCGSPVTVSAPGPNPCRAADDGIVAGAALLVQSPRPQAVQVAEDCEDDLGAGWEFCPWLFIKRLPPLAACASTRASPLLPRKSRHSPAKTLVLDLDETLVHSSLDGGGAAADFSFDVDMAGVAHRVAVRRRPHLHAFLHRVSQLFEVVVFTASQAVYAEQLLDVVDPGRRLIRHRVFRDGCVQWEGNYLKDLTALGRDLAHTCIVDNSPQAFGFQLDNGIPIESWYDDNADDELLRLLPFLEALAGADDVRPAIQQRFRLRELVDGVRDPCVRPSAAV